MTDFELGKITGIREFAAFILVIVGLLLLTYWGNGKDENK